MIYNIVLVSAIHQYESAIGKNMSLPSGPFLPSPTPSQPSRLSGSTGLSSLHHTNSHQRSILLMVMYMFPCYSLSLSHCLLPPFCPQVCSLCLCLHCCAANRIIKETGKSYNLSKSLFLSLFLFQTVSVKLPISAG